MSCSSCLRSQVCLLASSNGSFLLGQLLLSICLLRLLPQRWFKFLRRLLRPCHLPEHLRSKERLIAVLWVCLHQPTLEPFSSARKQCRRSTHNFSNQGLLALRSRG